MGGNALPYEVGLFRLSSKLKNEPLGRFSVAAELIVANGADADGSQEPPDGSRAALEAYLHERRMSEGLASPTTPRVPDRRAA